MLLKKDNFEFGDFILDIREKTLRRGEKTLALTPKAFALLQLLVENHGHLVEKDELLRAVWENAFVEEGNIAFTIWLLRKALGDRKENPQFIETVPKRGYRFIAEVRRVENPAAPTADDFHENLHENSPHKLNEAIDFHDSARDLKTFNPLFGREAEIASINDLLGCDAVQLITLTGAGGSGKTSLARVAAAANRARFPDGIYFVELAPIFNPELVVPAIAQTLDVKESGANSLFESLRIFLSRRRVLLVLDNFEQIAAAASQLPELIRAAPQLKILVTSRAALRLTIENELVVPPLTVPPPRGRAGAPPKKRFRAEDYSSVKMFAERARAAKASFALTPQNAADVGEICVRLDGLPLAIELAAARIKLLSPAAILDRLENRLRILTTRTRDVPARQQTMRDTVAWSYDLLEPREQELFRRLAIFVGGFTVEAAETVCAETENAETENAERIPENAETLDSLETLAANHLLQQTETGDGETRLSMLETIRQYAVEKLAEDEREDASMRNRHAAYFLAFARRTEHEALGKNQAATLRRIENERDNFRAAMDWSRHANRADELKIAASLAHSWVVHGYLSEGIERFQTALANNPDASAARVAKSLVWLGQLIWVKGDYVKALEVCESGLNLARKISYPTIEALALFMMGMSYWYRYDDAEKAIDCLNESIGLYRAANFDAGVVYALVVIAAICQTSGDLTPAEILLAESLEVAARTENNLALSISMINCGRLEIAKGNLPRAKFLCRESLRLRDEISDRWGVVQCLEPLAAVALRENKPRRAAKMLGAVDILLESLGASPPLIFRADHEPNVAAVRAALDADVFAAAFAAGRQMSTSELVKMALEDESVREIDVRSGQIIRKISLGETNDKLNNSGNAARSAAIDSELGSAANDEEKFEDIPISSNVLQ